MTREEEVRKKLVELTGLNIEDLFDIKVDKDKRGKDNIIHAYELPMILKKYQRLLVSQKKLANVYFSL